MPSDMSIEKEDLIILGQVNSKPKLITIETNINVVLLFVNIEYEC